MEQAKEDVLAFRVFPSEHWLKIWRTNPLERLNKEIKRRTRVVGFFPNDAAIIRLVGALLLEQQEEWQLDGRRVFSELSMAKLDNTSETVKMKNGCTRCSCLIITLRLGHRPRAEALLRILPAMVENAGMEGTHTELKHIAFHQCWHFIDLDRVQLEAKGKANDAGRVVVSDVQDVESWCGCGRRGMEDDPCSTRHDLFQQHSAAEHEGQSTAEGIALGDWDTQLNGKLEVLPPVLTGGAEWNAHDVLRSQ